jgi:methanogenic corrinoid protein MtbC1
MPLARRTAESTRSRYVNEELFVERLFQSLISGDRDTARSIVKEIEELGTTAEQITHRILWQALEMIDSFYRADQLTTLAHHYAMRLLCLLVDQVQDHYAPKPRKGRRLLLFSGVTESDELAGRMVANLIEADGYEVFFAGGGIANDEILGAVGEQKPDVLLMFASSPSDAPNIRLLIDTIREVGACPDMQIVVGGGVFNRAEGLAEEIGADLWAKAPAELIERMNTQPARRAEPDQRTVGRNRRAPARRAA